MRQLIFAAACLCLLPVFETRARAQGDPRESKGEFVTTLSGREVAREVFTFAPQPGGTLRAEAEIKNASGMNQKVVTAGARARPLSFMAEAGGAKVYGVEFGEGVATVTIAGQPARQVQTKANVVLENGLWHQFIFLFAQYDAARGGAQEFIFFAPNAERDFGITVERVDSPVYAVGGRQVRFEHYRMKTSAKLAIEAWTTEGRIPAFLDIPAAQLRGVRVGMEQLESLALAPVKKAAEYQPPSYAVPASFIERDVTVGAGTEWALPGTLTLPAGKGPFPAVVLVHGSGPNDRDETQGASKPFRDLAWGLASRGLAVLRYDKRTRVHPAKVVASANFTVKEETVDDALAAVALLRRTPSVDARRIFVLGHSLGAGLAPRIGAADPKIRGLVVLAGPTTPLEDAFVRQYKYLLALDGSLSDEDRKMIADAERQTARVKGLTDTDRGSKEMLHFAPVSYWLDLRAYDAVATARKLKMPILVLQGERDYNVTMEDFRNWQRLAAARKDVATKSYPKLDHLFLEGEGPARDSDYAVPRNVARYVVDDIIAFVKNH